MQPLAGIHHITAICGNSQQNLDFYAGTLGMRFVKRTVNFDDPEAYHFYFGDQVGTPGSILTFFPYPAGQGAKLGSGMVTRVGLQVPRGSVAFWQERLKSKGLSYEVHPGAGGEYLEFLDPDGLVLKICEADTKIGSPWSDGRIPIEHQVLGVRHAQIESGAFAKTERLLLDMGATATPTGLLVFADGSSIDLVPARSGMGQVAKGAVHHIAFRAADNAHQDEWHAAVRERGLHVSDTMDRFYFKSIYFREPSGTLFEIATDGPGFSVDEPVKHLGEALMLPMQYEPYRATIESKLEPISLPK